MRIELPTASWAETAQRAEDDAHTLTVAPQLLSDWSEAAAFGEPSPTVRMEVAATEPVELTLTF